MSHLVHEPFAGTGTLADREPHPAALDALSWVMDQPPEELERWRGAFDLATVAGFRTAAICGETLRRVLAGESVSDRYLLGLAWAMRFGAIHPAGGPGA